MSVTTLAATLASRGDRQNGVTPVYLHKVLSGERRPAPSRLSAIADALGLDPQQRTALIDAGMIAGLDPAVVSWLETKLASGEAMQIPSVETLFPTRANQATSRGRPRRRR